jgi:hypothetical protein
MRVSIIACLLAALSLGLAASAQQSKPEPKSEAKPRKPEAKPEAKPAAKPEAKPDAKPCAETGGKACRQRHRRKSRPRPRLPKANAAIRDAYAAMPVAERLAIQSDLDLVGRLQRRRHRRIRRPCHRGGEGLPEKTEGQGNRHFHARKNARHWLPQ